MPDCIFPKNKLEALALLYLQNQDLSGISPEELLNKYEETYEKLHEQDKRNKNAKNSWKL